MSQNGESPEFINNILQSLRDNEAAYSTGLHVYDTMWNRSATAVAGPTGVGKSFTSEEAVRLDPDVRLINTVTTRGHHDGDPVGFRTGALYAEFSDAVANENLVNYSVLGNDIYGTYQSGFTGLYNIGPIMTRSFPQLRKAGLKRFNVAYAVTDGETYEGRLRKERMGLENFVDRGIEGLISLEDARREAESGEIHFLDTSPHPEGPGVAARKLIAIARGDYEQDLEVDRAVQYLTEMTAALKRVVRDVQ